MPHWQLLFQAEERLGRLTCRWMLSKIKPLWRASSLLGTGGAPYEITCVCGQVARGWRQRTHQVLRCRHCDAPVFVLGRSPLPAVGKAPGPTSASAAQSWRILRNHRWLLGASVLALLAGGTLAVWWFSRSSPTQVANDADTLQAQMLQGEKYLAAGAFRRAAVELGAARSAWQRQPQLLTAAAGRHLEQLWQQASLLADLSDRTLEEILHHAAGTTRADWALEFAQRYRGKALCFDLEIHALAGKKFAHPYRLWARGVEAQLDLDNLDLLHLLPLDPPRRVLFLARLDAVERLAGRGWVVQLVPGSGVLLTDAAAVRFLCPGFADAPTQTLVERQAAWWKETAGAGRK